MHNTSPTPLNLPLRAAIVDLDGTLVDTAGDFLLALRSGLIGFSQRASTIDAAFVQATVGKGSEYLVERALRHLEVPESPAVFQGALEAYLTAYGDINGQASTVYAGVLEGLEWMRRQGWQLVCVTNKPGAYAQDLLRAKGLSPYFSAVWGGDAFIRKKPDPLPILEACRGLGLPPAQVLVVGDSANDAQAAHAAGCPVVLMRYGYNHGRPVEEIPALAHLDRMDELAGLGLPTPTPAL